MVSIKRKIDRNQFKKELTELDKAAKAWCNSIVDNNYGIIEDNNFVSHLRVCLQYKLLTEGQGAMTRDWLVNNFENINFEAVAEAFIEERQEWFSWSRN